MSNQTNVSQIKHEEFLFLGKEYSADPGKELDFGQIFGNFFDTGGYEKIAPHEKNKDEHCCDTIVFYKKSPDYKTVYIGKIADGINEAPEGHVLKTFPVSEFIVVTSEWKAEEGEAMDAVGENEKTMQPPNGYVKDENSTYVCVEKMFYNPDKGHRWERWYPIIKRILVQ